VAIGKFGRCVVVVVLPAISTDAQLSPQPVKVSAAAVVLELACHLYLLGLGSAAPHWLDPPEHPEPYQAPVPCTEQDGLHVHTAARRSPPPGARRAFEPACIYYGTCFTPRALPSR